MMISAVSRRSFCAISSLQALFVLSSSLFVLMMLIPTSTGFSSTSTNKSGANAGVTPQSSSSSSSCSVAVIGCGVLGTRLCQQLLQSPDFEGWTVTGITKTTNNHEKIISSITSTTTIATGTAARESNSLFQVKTMDDIKKQQQQGFDHVVFCAPPSGFEDYAGAVQDAITTVWSGPEKGGSFVFTSSGGIHGPGTSTFEPEIITETSPPADIKTNPRSAGLVAAEEICRTHGGCCLRLAGLYTLERGAHSYWLNTDNNDNNSDTDNDRKEIVGRSDGLINLVSYDDAAGAVLSALQVGSKVTRGKNFLISDGHPLTRQQICESAVKTALYRDKPMPKFIGSSENNDPIGKLYDGTVSERALHWKPRYESFDDFCEMHS